MKTRGCTCGCTCHCGARAQVATEKGLSVLPQPDDWSWGYDLKKACTQLQVVLDPTNDPRRSPGMPNTNPSRELRAVAKFADRLGEMSEAVWGLFHACQEAKRCESSRPPALPPSRPADSMPIVPVQGPQPPAPKGRPHRQVLHLPRRRVRGPRGGVPGQGEDPRRREARA